MAATSGSVVMSREDEALHRLLLRVPNRRRVFDAIVEIPGTHARRLSRELEMALGVVEHHVRHLEKHALVFTFQRGRRRTLYAAGHIEPEDARILHVLRKPAWMQIVKALLEQERGVSDLARELGIPVATMSYHLRRLRSDGLLDHVKAGREAAYLVRDPSRVGRLLENLDPKPMDLGGSWQGLVERARKCAALPNRRHPRDARVQLAAAQD